MRKLLLFFTFVLTALGVKAADISGDGISGGTAGYDPKIQTLVISKPGALAAWVAEHTGDNYDRNNPFGGLGGSDNFYGLHISGTLNADDIAALNSSTCAAFSRFPRIDMSEVTLAEGTDKSALFNVNFGPASFQHNSETKSGNGATYIRMPNDMTEAEDVAEMAKMKQGGKNPNLKVVGAYDPDNDNFDGDGKYAEVAMHSFEANSVTEYISFMRVHTSGNPTVVPRKIRMSGEYGDKDLVGDSGPNFGYGTSAEWDFTGAHFSDCTIAAATQDATYYNYDDPFCEHELVACPTTTNSFYWFSQYCTAAVDLKLPDTNMTHLPFRCLNDMASDNVSGYKALYGADAFNANKATDKFVPIESLRIPDCYTDLDEECGKWAHIRHLYIGSGMKRIHGGAFLKCDQLEDLDFAAGLSNCYIGDRAFNECRSMKHIALSEGIVSLGNGAFWNSQHLESIRLPQSLKYMGNHCFDNCLALNSITIPENVEKIGKCAFRLCPFTDIYLTTTDPAKIPIVWSCGNNFLDFDGNCTFHHGHIDGWEGGIDADKDKIDGIMTFDEAAEFYFTHWNGMPTLHYPTQLAEALHAEISSTYQLHSSDGYGLPMRIDMDSRDDIPGADLGTSGTGKWTRDGWAQFMMMKEFSFDPGQDVYQQKFEDVWYTICYPFDLTDEQLAAAFNETFNIVDFSGVEIQNEDENEEGKKTLILHFNTVGKTYYRDSEGNEYNVIGREKDPVSGFNYNIYEKDGVQYHHSQVSAQLSSNKTKTFAEGNSIDQANANKANAFIIDGYLVTAGHPYMVHPAIGTSLGNPQKCNFSGIEWKPQTQWPAIYEAQKREVDLGVKKGEPETSTPDADNYMQAAYGNYAGQTYTFKGNPVQYQEGAQDEIGDEPEVLDEPVRPVKPTEEEVEALKPAETLEAPSPVVQDPDNNSKYSDDFKELFKTVRVSWTGWTGNKTETIDYTYGEDLVNYTWEEFLTKQDWYNDQYGPWYIYNTRSNGHNADGVKVAPLESYLGAGPLTSNEGFNTLKQLAADYTADKAAYAEYQVAFNAYVANRAAWAIYNAKVEELATWNDAEKEQEYQAALTAYQNSVAAHDTWLENAKSWQVLIPTGAYFLGRQGTAYPKYYREIADDTRSGATGGFWTQFTAVIIPNAAAKAGIEAELGEGTSAAANRSVEMVFDEGFLGEEKTSTEIEQIITEAEAEGQKVEYMQVVYNINGQIVREGTELTGLPKGIYIVNGKKYFVR